MKGLYRSLTIGLQLGIIGFWTSRVQEIASRALDTAVKTAAMNSLYRMYVFARKAQTELYYVAIPEDFVFESQEPFDIEEMNRLFNIGFAQATSANPWEQKLPGWGLETN